MKNMEDANAYRYEQDPVTDQMYVTSGQSQILNEHDSSITTTTTNNNSNPMHAMGLPSRERMAHWSTNGQLISSPISQLSSGARSIIEHSLEEHKEFRRLQRSRMEQQLENRLTQDRINQMHASLSSIESTRSSSSIAMARGISTTSLSHASGAAPELSASLTSSFRPRSAAAAVVTTPTPTPNNNHLLNPVEPFSSVVQQPLSIIVMKKQKGKWAERDKIENERKKYGSTGVLEPEF